MKKAYVLCPDATLQGQVRSVLSEYELEGQVFDTVDAAYNALVANPPALFVLSNRLSATVSGLDFIHALKEKGRLKSVTVVLMGDVGDIDPLLLKDLGIEEALLDPLNPQDFRLVLRRYFQPRHSQAKETHVPRGEPLLDELSHPIPAAPSSTRSDVGGEGEVEQLNDAQLEDISPEERQAWGMVELKRSEPRLDEWSGKKIEPSNRTGPDKRVDEAPAWKHEPPQVRHRAAFEDLPLTSLLEIADEALGQVLEEFANRLYEEMYEVFLSFTKEMKGKIDRIAKDEVRSWVRYRMNEAMKKRIKYE
jgi:DNA-binding response OmpR family regulator